MDDKVTMSTLRAIAHPVRLRILSLLTGSAMSAAEVARELDLTHANASYHLRFLAEAGEVVEAGEEKIRGGVAKKYRHPWQEVSGVRDPRVTDEDRALYIRAMAEEMVRRYGERLPGTPGSMTDAELWVTPEVWSRALELVERASHLVHAEAKRPRADGTVRMNMTTAVFRMTASGATSKGDEK
jgi:DNA-binding transcriptional ArsR family regulator